ncbi:sulfide-dependent adenosine diphosphate thiazole synthase [Pseudoramibacter faecis]|uniref:sulfide-dependent adenosine diphosphate thiazole synthase n=1 Tax=Pseudoramibacter faecis TaxID=3108534 RepID=UPI002E79E2DA|nr:sulfide-dependent adenosine diphosphate thiazole synthase [Pseudoramibacter sp. HA2172]
MLSDTKISEAILTTYTDRFKQVLSSDAVIVGGGPSGLIAAYYLGKAGVKTTLLDRRLSVGGGMWGGGMMMNQIVVQKSVLPILEEMGIACKAYDAEHYTVSSVACISGLIFRAAQSDATIMNLVTMEDDVVREGRLEGLVINWSTVEMAHLMVDPLMMDARVVLDATGHDAALVTKLVERMGPVLNTPSGGLEGEKPMWADHGEKQVVANTREAYPGLYVSGMAANATFGGQRMGPVFGGMLLSGKKAAEAMLRRLEQ